VNRPGVLRLETLGGGSQAREHVEEVSG
jgi:hypothetical protein